MWIAFQYWPITIYRYGIAYLFSFVSAYLIILYIVKQNILPHSTQVFLQKNLDDLVSYSVVGVIVWGRLWHVLIYDPAYYWLHPNEIIAVRKWGMSFVGWFIWVGITTLLFARKRFDTLTILDLILLTLPIGIIVWRYANYLNQELYGRIANWYEFLARYNLVTIYQIIDNQLRRNTNFLELLFEWVWGLIVVWAVYYHQKQRKPWLITWAFMVWYSIVRFVLENFRDNPMTEYLRWINKTQWWMVVFLIIWCILIQQSRKISHKATMQ